MAAITSGNMEVGVVVEFQGERVLGLGLAQVVELFGDPIAQLGQHRLDVETGKQRAEQLAQPGQLGEVAEQGLTGSRVLDLDRDLPAVMPDGLVHLADRGGRGRLVVERQEVVAPVVAELLASTLCTVAAGSGGAAS